MAYLRYEETPHSIPLCLLVGRNLFGPTLKSRLLDFFGFNVHWGTRHCRLPCEYKIKSKSKHLKGHSRERFCKSIRQLVSTRFSAKALKPVYTMQKVGGPNTSEFGNRGMGGWGCFRVIGEVLSFSGTPLHLKWNSAAYQEYQVVMAQCHSLKCPRVEY